MAAEEKASAPAPASPAPSGGGGGNKVVLLLTLVNVVVTAAIGGLVFVSFKKEKNQSTISDIAPDEHAPKEEAAAEGGHGGGGGHGGAKEGAKKKTGDFGKIVTLDQFTVNLSTPGSATPKYARVNISIEVPNEDSEIEVNQKMPQVRNVVIDLFNSKRPSDLASAEGRDYLKEEIRNAVNEFMVKGKIKGVFFTNFAVAG
ncbi:flagellar basal body-associated FliL family protein [bacterium]|jgi:flagellar FliL protein|nr:flagellar basal body-associated FliL family protein [bacterium]